MSGRRTARKLPYYARSLAALARIATLRSIVRCAVLPDKRLDLREGGMLRLTTAVDLLVVKETWVDDAYGLRDVRADEGSLIVDIGAGIGEFALAASRLFPAARIVAFEPNPRTFLLLESNLRAFGAANVAPVQAAVGTEPRYTLGSVSAGPRTSALAVAEDEVDVRGVKLDDVLPQRAVALLKIDCEGLELDALRSAQATLARVRAVSVEYHRHLVRGADALVTQLLTAHGFTTRSRPDAYDDAIGYIHAVRVSGMLPASAVRTEHS